LEKIYLSIVIPAYNEELRIEKTISNLVSYFSKCSYNWEIIVVDDGSLDSTCEIVLNFISNDSRIKLFQLNHLGKGSAVRKGMHESKGDWKFLCDADLSMDINNFSRFLSDSSSPNYDICIASREVEGSIRFNEPMIRHIKGRLFNYAVKVFTLMGIQDTQCGFKLFSKKSSNILFSNQKFNGWAFDVEILVIARQSGFTIKEIPISWYYKEGSKMTLIKGFLAVVDVAKIGLNSLLGRYKRLSGIKNE
tara:strand:+ start:55437 stop:56183 length:747 start_codon:yes stop_codon:yes gene_type:complete